MLATASTSLETRADLLLGARLPRRRIRAALDAPSWISTRADPECARARPEDDAEQAGDARQGLEEDVEVHGERHVVDVPPVVLELLVAREGVAVVDLRPAGDAGSTSS